MGRPARPVAISALETTVRKRFIVEGSCHRRVLCPAVRI
jgi:hypothetical protein